MSKYFIEDTTLTDIADQLRLELDTTQTYNPEDMPLAIHLAATQGGGGGEWLTNDRGLFFQPEHILTVNDLGRMSYKEAFANETRLIKATLKGTASAIQNIVFNDALSNIFGNCTSLTHLYLPNTTVINSWIASGCTALQEVQIGSIGYPVTSIRASNPFERCTQAGLTITVYVADDATLPLANQPWGATKATVVYRSATTGEVLN